VCGDQLRNLPFTKELYFSTDSSVTQGVLTPNATVLAAQRLVRQSTTVEEGHLSQLGVQMRLTRVNSQPGHSLDRAACKCDGCSVGR
jgi:hypothetical protein